MKDFFIDLYRYNQRMNQLVFNTVETNEQKVSARVLEVCSHILLVHQNWNARMSGLPQSSNLWEVLPQEHWNAILDQCTRQSFDILNQKNIDKQFHYSNSKGMTFTNTYRDALFHVINHGSYHRGQINMDLRQCGVEPVITEYIFYKR